MPDREKVIDALEKCAAAKCDERCPYSEIQYGCRPKLMLDAMAMLKEQEPVEIEIEGGGSTWWYVCEKCRGSVDGGDRFCRHCGRPFKPVQKGGCNGCTYKGSEDCPLGFIDSGNFYCPNGKLI